jgi:hypothetical protein
MPLRAAWDNSFVTNLSYSNGDKTVAFAGDGFAFSTTSYAVAHQSNYADRSYAEITIGALVGTSADTYPRIGISTKDKSKTVWLQRDGAVTNRDNWQSIAAQPHLVFNPGDVISIAFDFPSTSLWVRVNGGPWNAGGAANPSVLVGGINYSASGVSGLEGFVSAEWVGAAGPIVTINTGDTPFLYPIPDRFAAWDDTLPPSVSGWNETDRARGLGASGYKDKIVTRVSGNGGIRSTQTYDKATAAKLYAEFHVTVIPTGSSHFIGLLSKTSALDVRTNGAYISATGAFWIDPPNTSVACLGALLKNDVVSMAWDTAANRIWFRQNAGSWNNNATHDPATGAGGFDVAAIAAGDYALYCYLSGALAVDTLRTETHEFTQVVPAGFSAWSATVQPAYTGMAALSANVTRTNWLHYSNSMNNWYFTGATAVADATTAPDGTLTAEKFTDTATNQNHASYMISTEALNGKQLTFSVYAKADTLTWLQLYHVSPTGTVNFNLATGVIGAISGVALSPTIQSVGNGWYRCSITYSLETSTSSPYVVLKASDVAGYVGYLGTLKSLYLWGAQLEIGATPTALIETTTTYRTVTIGQPPDRQNLIVQSQTIDNAAWNKTATTITANSGSSAPDGTMTADIMVNTATDAEHLIRISAGIPEISPVTFSAYAKCWNLEWIRLRLQGLGREANFNINSGTIGYVSAGVTARIEPLLNGWFRISITVETSGTIYPCILGLPSDMAGASVPYLGTVNDKWILWGIQCEISPVATAYMPRAGLVVPAPASPVFGTGVVKGIRGAWESLYVNDGAAIYSNGDRTATMNSPGYPSSTDSRLSGSNDLVYCEIGIDVSGAPNYPTICGIDQLNYSLGIHLWYSGRLTASGSSYDVTHAHLAYTTGAVLGFAYKAATNEAWVRVNNGAWNAGGTADPATGVGGLNIGGANPKVITGEGSYGTVLTINTGTVAFVNAPPSGFSAWYSIADNLVHLSPDADIAADGWLTQADGAVNLYQSIAAVSDLDYAQSPALAGPTSDLAVRLYEGSTLVQAWTHNNVGDTFTDAVQTVTGSISNAANLFVELDDLQGNVYRFSLGNPPALLTTPEIRYRYKKLVN